MSARSSEQGAREWGSTWARLTVVYLLVLAGCATGVSGGVGGHPLPGPSRPSAEGAALEAPSTADEDDDPEDDGDEEAHAATEVTGAAETPSRARPGPTWAEGEEELEEGDT
ncbi:MAG TPA: hypothetical protein VK458_20025, partial [Myxococcaceae bacterium]|nr:hypothetical protein [Myxococcaceae bacterium]